jgi:hypothetical protein
MSAVLYYSNYCEHCKNLLFKLSRSKSRDDLHFICIDKRERNKDGTTNIILENGQRLLMPPNIKKVPAILLLHHGNRAIDGLKEITDYLNPGETTINNKATDMNGEPLAFSMSEMGHGLSDNYSYLDMSAEDLSAKGNGGLRMMHNYTGWQQNTTIATPPEDYVPNKVGNIDMGKLQEQRNKDVSNKK